ncbi:MAG: hypothetical protein Q8K86_08825 [Candidatus Nanopelagicaceae bacterium]|nr:hypothetical protein [Candidatus Nanopelagicaceae bacterium]
MDRERAMQKIKDLLSKIGASKDLTEGIVNELTRFTREAKERLDKDYKDRVETAKKVCTEEVEKYKRELSRKVAVYLESKQAQVARTVEKQLATEGTEASDKLMRVKALIENVQLKTETSLAAEDHKQLRERATALEQSNVRLLEERNSAVAKAQRAMGIANEVLAANRKLEAAGKPVAESVAKPAGKPVVESVAKPAGKPVLVETKPTELKPLATKPAEGKQRLSDMEKIARGM